MPRVSGPHRYQRILEERRKASFYDRRRAYNADAVAASCATAGVQVLSPRTLSLFYIENTSVHRKVCRRMVWRASVLPRMPMKSCAARRLSTSTPALMLGSSMACRHAVRECGIDTRVLGIDIDRGR